MKISLVFMKMTLLSVFLFSEANASEISTNTPTSESTKKEDQSTAAERRLSISASYGQEYYVSGRRFFMSSGYTLGAHFELSDELEINISTTAIPYSGKTFRIASGIEYSHQFGFWQPSIAAEARLLFGDSIAYSLNSNSVPDPTFFSVSPSVKVALLQFSDSEGSRVSIITPNAGPVFFDGKVGLQATVSLVEVLAPL